MTKRGEGVKKSQNLVDVICVSPLELLADEGGDEERGEAVGADDEAVHGRAEAGLLRYPGEEGREEADGEGRGERRHEQHRQDQPLARRDAAIGWLTRRLRATGVVVVFPPPHGLGGLPAVRGGGGGLRVQAVVGGAGALEQPRPLVHSTLLSLLK